MLPTHPEVLGVYMGLEGIGAVATAFLLSQKTDIKSPALWIALGFVFLSAGAFLFAAFQSAWSIIWLYCSAILLVFGTGINFTLYSYLIKKDTAEQQMGCVTGVTGVWLNLALGLGTLTSGFWVMLFGMR